MSGGAGYVLSRGALDKFVNHALTDTEGNVCRTKDDAGFEDVEIGKCLQNVNVTAGDSRDETGRSRFFAVIPDKVLISSTFLAAFLVQKCFAQLFKN
jgi:glycoprotein-N-acetylgalactosamine 3-beta-galactosyltransferase